MCVCVCVHIINFTKVENEWLVQEVCWDNIQDATNPPPPINKPATTPQHTPLGQGMDLPPGIWKSNLEDQPSLINPLPSPFSAHRTKYTSSTVLEHLRASVTTYRH